MASSTLYLAWQDERSRRWFTVGRPRRMPEGPCEFVYVKGYEDAHRLAGMQPILDFLEIDLRHRSERLFPQFQNRIMSPEREDYEAYLRRLGFDAAPEEPLEILARSEGHRATDSLQVFPAPAREQDEGGRAMYSLRFFVHGMRYMRPEVQKLDLEPGMPLSLMWDWQNEHDPRAVMLRTQANELLGWLPRYYDADVHDLRERGQRIDVTVEHMNQSPVPSCLRLMCRVEATWPEGFQALAGVEFQPIPPGTEA